MIIRTLTAKDILPIVAIVEACQESLSLSQFNWNQSKIERAMESSLGFGLFDKDLLVGFAIGRELGGAFEIDVLATHPNFRKLGYMTQLINDLKVRYSILWLEVHERNTPALNFYKKQGFRITGRRPRYYTDGGAAINLTFDLSKGD